ncbi:hypothetical protein ACEN2I_02520 [Flavobacterium sp. W22_SRS_FK3]|uniref:hypothetical protein n=1 Tax=Flavobacterium sp. W22_SRS_FK3 TaxID=3240275 RepID=UPI003F8DEEF5
MDLYIFLKILIASIAATSAMTLFSYVISKSFRELYKEPVLLTFVLSKLKLDLPLKTKTTIAWFLHYFIGLFFVTSYHLFWVNDILKTSFLNALLLGALSGIVGIIGWILLFKIADFKPKIDFKGYYIQLFFAHVIFGITATFVYCFLQ